MNHVPTNIHSDSAQLLKLVLLLWAGLAGEEGEAGAGLAGEERQAGAGLAGEEGDAGFTSETGSRLGGGLAAVIDMAENRNNTGVCLDCMPEQTEVCTMA